MFIPVLRHRRSSLSTERSIETPHWSIEHPLRMWKYTILDRPQAQKTHQVHRLPSSYSCSFSTPHVLRRCLNFLLILSKQGRLLTEVEGFYGFQNFLIGKTLIPHLHNLPLVWSYRYIGHFSGSKPDQLEAYTTGSIDVCFHESRG